MQVIKSPHQRCAKFNFKIITRNVYFKKRKNKRLTVVYNILKKDGSVCAFTIEIEDGNLNIENVVKKARDVKIIINEDDYLRLVEGKLDYEGARWIGRIRYIGNQLAHRELNTYFSIPKVYNIKYI